MILRINCLIYIVYGFIILFAFYICWLTYKNFSYLIFKNQDNVIVSEKNSNKKNLLSNSSKKSNKIMNIKRYFKIKSTEKTFDDIKFISNKPYYIKINDSKQNYENLFLNSNETNCLKNIKNYNNDIVVNKITNIYIRTKQEFYNVFVNTFDNKYFINNLNDFSLFYKNNVIEAKNYKNNIIIKLFDEPYIQNNNYLYIYVDGNNIIKIVNNIDYDNICNMIEKNNGIFLLTNIKNSNNKTYYIGYGNYTQSKLNPSDIINIFFSNKNNYQLDKNYQLFIKYKFVKIYFFICNEI